MGLSQADKKNLKHNMCSRNPTLDLGTCQECYCMTLCCSCNLGNDESRVQYVDQQLFEVSFEL